MTTYATAIRDAMATRVFARTGYKTLQKTFTPTIEPADLPILRVFIKGERLESDGDDNAGAPHFFATMNICVSVVRGFEDPTVLDGTMDSEIDAIENLLLSDTSFVHWGPNALFEGIQSITRSRLYPSKGEAYFSEMMLEFEFTMRTDFPPNVADDFDTHLNITPNPALPTH